MQTHKLFGFTNVDQTNDAEYYIRFLDTACAEESFQAYKHLTVELLDVQEGHHVLELGCGTGDDARALAPRVGPTGAVVCVDSSQAMIAEAQKRAAGSAWPLEFHVADAHRLPFADNTFDGCRADRIFMHLENPLQCLCELQRVAKPGARIVLYEVDFETVTIDAQDRVLARKIVNTWCDSFRNGWLGRHLPVLFREVGLHEIRIIPHTLRLNYALAAQVVGPATVERAVTSQTITSAEARAWLHELEEAEKAGRFFSTLTGFLVMGRKERP